MARQTRTVADHIRILNERHTQKEIARMLGISERTVRRYKTGETAPKESALIKQIRQAGNRAAQTLYKHGYAKATIPIPRFHRKTKTAEWVNYDVRGRTLLEMHQLIREYAHSPFDYLCQIVVEITTGKSKGERVSKKLDVVRGWTDKMIWEFINENLWLEFSGDEGDEDKGLPNKPLYIGFKLTGV